MRARVYDPTAKPWLARGIPLVALAIAALFFVPGDALFVRADAILGAIAVFLGGPLFMRRGVVGASEIELAPGRLVARTADAAITVDAADITSAATLRRENGCVLAIGRGGADRPMYLEVSSEKDARAIHDALGLGDGDIGVITCRPTSNLAKLGLVFRAVFALFACVLGAFVESPLLPIAVAAGTGLLVLAFVAAVIVANTSRSRVLTVNRESLAIDGGRSVPLASIASAYRNGAELRVVGTDGATHGVPMSLPEREIELLANVVESRARLARDGALARPELPKSIAALAQAGEPARSWLARLDAIASSAGYREAGVDPDELWRALRDPEAPADVRAAAARILLRVDPSSAPTRVENVLATAHDGATKERIRIATDDDLDAAARDLEALDRKSS